MLIKATVLSLVVIALLTAAAWSSPDPLRMVQVDWLRDTLDLRRHFARERTSDVEEDASDGPLQVQPLVYDGIYIDYYWIK
jgi:hypothetical protein